MSAIVLLPIHLVDVTSEKAFRAAELKVKYRLYWVDSFAAALAVEHKATLVIGDSHFRRLAHTFPIVWLKA